MGLQEARSWGARQGQAPGAKVYHPWPAGIHGGELARRRDQYRQYSVLQGLCGRLSAKQVFVWKRHKSGVGDGKGRENNNDGDLLAQDPPRGQDRLDERLLKNLASPAKSIFSLIRSSSSSEGPPGPCLLFIHGLFKGFFKVRISLLRNHSGRRVPWKTTQLTPFISRLSGLEAPSAAACGRMWGAARE